MKQTGLLILIVFLIIPLLLLMTYQGSSNSIGQTTNSTPTPTPQPTLDSTKSVTASKVRLKTNKGDINIVLFKDDAPRTVTNFVTLGSQGYYNNLTFHRIIKSFMIQGGDPTGTGAGGKSIYGNTFDDEFNDRKIVRGTLAMANAGLDENGSGTNGSQFFIVTERAQPQLDGKHTNFGQVDEASMAVVLAIAAVPVDASDKPLEPVTISGFEILEP